MIKIPNDLQSVLSASYHVNSFKGAVEELIYNSLDAGSTSIAVRANISENSIQVIDNGSGIKGNDFNLLGQRYTTSKFDNLTVLKSIPLAYGYRGLSLASVIEVSREVKIVSRFQDSKETFCKVFRKGKCKEITETTSRPSKGTTVEIYGLLYNLNIQRKSLDHCSEIFAIKTFLEQLSLVHLNVSLSLRNDEKNEIIFNVHKNRNIFQTMSSLFDVNSDALQEIKVEKNQYKVKGFIGKRDIELKKCQWIFLNGKYVSKTILHKITNKKFMEILHIRKHKPKNKKKLGDELSNEDLPTYFLFISCPYSDYDINTDARKTTVEFKSWAPITNLVEKLIQCYSGDFKFKEIIKPNYMDDKQINANKEINTRAEVKRIMEKILAKNSKKHIPSSEMCNGIKGKNINRKHKRTDRLKVASNKIKHNVSKNILPSKNQSNSSKLQKLLFNKKTKFKNLIINEAARPENKKTRKLKTDNKKEKNSRNKEMNTDLRCKLLPKANEHTYYYKEELLKPHKIIENPLKKQRMVSTKNALGKKTNIFETELHHAKCTKLSPRQYFYEKYINTDIGGIKNKKIITSYDLVKTILNCTTVSNNLGIVYTHDKNAQESSQILNYPEFKNHKEIISTKLTYESHNYTNNGNKNMLEKRSSTNMHFISKESRDNFLSKNKQYKIIDTRHGAIKNKKNWRSNKQSVFNSVKLGIEQSLYSIQLSNSSFNRKLHTHNSTILYPKSISESLDTYTNIFNSLIQKNKDTENVEKTLDNIVSEIDRSNIEINSNHNTYNITYSIHSSKKYTKTSQTKVNNEKADIFMCENINGFTSTNTKDIKTIDNILSLDEVINLEVKNISSEIPDPLNMCETIYNARNALDEYNNSNYQSLPNNDNLLNANSENQVLSRRNEKQTTESNNKNILSHHLNTEEINDIFMHTFYSNINNHNENCSNIPNSFETRLNKFDDFNIQSRYTFVPKGMSPIFTNCNPKSAGKENLDDEYYKDELYKNFAQQVIDTAQIFEPKIQNINDTNGNHISKVNNKMKKDNADLMFDAKSIKNAKVLGQVDCKFIVTILSGKTVTNNTSSNFLVLFDQHAVHERIRLENNLLDYFDGIVWKSVKIDVICFKLSDDDVVLLHNHKDKLNKFGLQWSILDKNISINAIPEAILGKYPRQVDVVLSATKCLLSELIDALKSLKGNIPVYPQSIMNLVFSEACRYAIMFGDKLSKSNCINLIASLAECKTPFQCAHGRPVMAVIMELTEEQPRYKINFSKVKQFKDARNMEFTKK